MMVASAILLPYGPGTAGPGTGRNGLSHLYVELHLLCCSQRQSLGSTKGKLTKLNFAVVK